jgi:hypothetical protein
VKWLFLIVGLALVWPLSQRLRRKPRERIGLFFLVGFLPLVTRYEHFYMAIIDWGWIGHVKGAEVSYLDLLALAMYLSLPPTGRRLPFRAPMALYLVATVLSAIQATFPTAALFYSWQLARVFFLYATVYRGVCADPRIAEAVLKGMGGGILLEAAFTVWQRFGLGILQASGTFPGQNALGLDSHLIVIPFFALSLGKQRGWLPPAVVAAGLVAQIMTTSRATILLSGLGLITVFVLSALRQWSSRKAQALLAGVVAAAIFIPLAASSLQQRFGGAAEVQFAEDTERIRFKEAAADMLSDHPMGVGANHYTFAANMQGYFDRVGELWGQGRASNVHNTYWLVAAETGYLGLVTYVVLLLCPLWTAFACGLRHVGDARGDLVLGLGVALLTVYLHSFEEWITVIFETQYLFAIDIGLIAGLATELGYWRRTEYRS